MSQYLTRGYSVTGASYGGNFPDPWEDIASMSTPTNMPHLLKACERIFNRDGVTRQAMDRVLSYFITDLEISGVSDDEKVSYEEFLYDKLGIQPVLRAIGMDYLCYGNSFISILMPFKRYLSCKRCHFEAPLKNFYDNGIYDFSWSNYAFHARCPKCKYYGEWTKIDRRSDNDQDISIKRWPVHEIELVTDQFSHKTSYIWKIPQSYKNQIKEGLYEHLSSANWEVIDAIKHGNNIKFEKDVIFHLKEDTLAGINNQGWGIPRLLSNYTQIWQVQVLRRFNEAIALDYIIPFRVITPAPGAGGGGDPSIKDPINNFGLGGFVSRVGSMLRGRRRDPASWHVLPFPIQYQAVGGEAKQMAPKDLLEQAYDVLLNSLGVPVELYKGSITLQAAPTALRLFESNWNHLVYNLNRVLEFVMHRLSVLLSWEPAKAKLKRVMHADDLNRQLAKLNLMTQGLISPSTGLESIGIKFKEELTRQMDDERQKAEAQNEFTSELEASGLMQQMVQGQDPTQQQPAEGQQSGGGGQQGAMPPAYQSIVAQLPIGPNQQISPEELLANAQTVAQQLMSYPEGQKDSELRKLKQIHPSLHAMVRAVMDDIRRQARQQGGAMMLQQQFPKTAAVVQEEPESAIVSYFRNYRRNIDRS